MRIILKIIGWVLLTSGVLIILYFDVLLLLNAIIDIIYNGISFIDVLVIVFRELIAFITGGILFIIGMLILTSLEE